jgi:hypothetical protein
MPTFLATFSAPYVTAVWLFIVLPSFLGIGSHSLLWKWPVTVIAFAGIGAITMLGAMWFQLAPLLSGGVGFAALSGAVAGLFASVYQQRLRKRTSA